MRMKRIHPAVRNVLADLVLAGLVLVVFALFHHVLPRQQQGIGIQIENPYRNSGSAMLLADTAVTSGVRYGSESLSAKGGRREQQQTSSGKGGSALESGEGTETAADDTDLQEKFAEMYTDTVVRTENSYTSPNVAVTVSRETTDDGRITYYLADIYLRDITCFRTALARDTFGSGYRDSIANMAALTDALVAVNGDYYGNTGEGVVIRNGVIYRANRTDCDVCVLYYDGSMRVMAGSDFDMEQAIADGAWQAWTFGPSLLDGEGNAITSFDSTRRMTAANPRTAIGCWEPGHYCMVVVDGRGDSAGITLPELSALFAELGCTAAYNLDGGNSSIMVWSDEVINSPSGGGRESSDALMIVDAV